MKKYSDYKDSGIEWIGEIPSHWELPKLWHLAMMNDVEIQDGNHGSLYPKQEDFKHEGVFFIKPRDIREEKVNFSTCDCLTKDHAESLRIGFTYPNDVLLVNRGGTIGRFARMKSIPDGYDYVIINPQMTYIRSSNRLNSDFFFYFGVSKSFQQSIDLVKAFGSTFPFLGLSTMGNFPFPFPPIEEQTAIANYLDRKTAEIDDLIAKKEQLIELYKEERTATINQAVTKGLDPNVPMKDSGIEWLGEIPEHWEVKPLKYLGSIVNGNSFKSDDFVDKSECRVMKISNIQTMKVDWSDDSYLPNEFYNEYPNHQINKGDLVFALTRPIISTGIKATIVDQEDRILLNQRNAVFRPIKSETNRWLYYIILSSIFLDEFDSLIDKTGQQPNISSNDIANISIPIPPVDECLDVLGFLENKFASIDSLITYTEQEITLLKEYKTALISEVVLGKVDVREEAVAH